MSVENKINLNENINTEREEDINQNLSMSDKLKNYLDIPFLYIKNGIKSKVQPFIKENIVENPFFNIPMIIVKQSNHKNEMIIKMNEKEIPISYFNRRVAVFSLMAITSLYYYKRRSQIPRFKFRWLIPTYLFYSILLCRENLTPYQI